MNANKQYPQYPNYKDSGVDWLGQIPAHWEVKHGFTIFKENKDSNKGMKETLVLSLSYGNIIIRPQENLFGLIPESFETYQIVNVGDIIIRCTDLQNDKTSLRTGLAKNKGIITSAYLNLRIIDDSLSEYIHKLLHVLDITKFIYKLGSGLRQNLSFNDFKRLPILKPPLAEQQQIADYLDHKTVLIEQAVALKQQQIALLQERLQILIQNAVTKGLNPQAPLENSNIDWLGQIPAHWEVLPLKRIVTFNPSPAIKNKNLLEKVCFLPMEKVSTSGEIQCDTLLPIKDVAQGFTYFAKNDVIVAKITPCFENGKSAYLEKLTTDIGFGSTEFHVLRSSKSIIGKFLYLIISSNLFLKTGEAMMTGSAGQKRVPSSFIKNYLIALPKVNEQQQIADYLDKKSTETEQAIDLMKEQIKLLQEYKNILINEAVTGKIDLSHNRLGSKQQ